MKLIKRNNDNSVVLILEDDAQIDFSIEPPIIDGSYYGDLNSKNCEVVENCGSPEDTLTDENGNPMTFWGNKFIYTDAWTLNPDWVEPVEEPAQ